MTKKVIAFAAAFLIFGICIYFISGSYLSGSDSNDPLSDGSVKKYAGAEPGPTSMPDSAAGNNSESYEGGENSDFAEYEAAVEKSFNYGRCVHFPDEDYFLDLVKKYTAAVKADSLSTEEAARLLILFKRKLEVIQPEAINGPFYAYKYPCRVMAEHLYKTGAAHDYLRDADYNFFYNSEGRWNGAQYSSLWDFKGYEKAVYDAYFKSDSPKGALWGLECFVSCRDCNVRLGCKLECEWLGCSLKSLLSENECPLEVFRQMFMYSSYQGRVERSAFIFSVFPKDFKLEGISWCELGYGTGAVFNFVRDKIGQSGKIYGVERDLSCLKFAKDLINTGVSGWGAVSIVKNKYDSCNMPPNSVDVFSEDGVHIGVARDRKTWDNFVLSLKKALKPGGVVLSIGCGKEHYSDLHQTMLRNGFESAFEKIEKDGDEMGRYICAFRVKKADK